MKIVMSSGHGKYIRGAAGPSPWGLDEVDEARKVVDATAKILRENGVECKTYHDDVSTSQNENLNRIVDFHNAQTRDLDVSIHFNAYEVKNDPMGCEVLYVSSLGRDIADTVVEEICTASGLKNRGPKERSDLFFLNNTEEPAILIETCFCDSHADTDIYRAKFDSICYAIAEGIWDGELDSDVEPPLGERPPPPEEIGDQPALKKGSTGPDVIVLQKALGVLEPDGDFGSTTETWVKAFQAACDLEADGIVGPMTWEKVADLDDRKAEGPPPLPKNLAAEIYTMAQQSELADYSWPDRGIPPPGYIAGMALCFAVAVQRWHDGYADAEAMGEAEGDPDKDALAWYKNEFLELGMYNKTDGLDTLRHLFVMQIGLGPRESSGKYCEGRDLSADNVQSETAEAGLFQTSWNIKGGSSAIGPLLEEFWENPNGFLDVFKDGIVATKSNLDSYGSGDGARYQFLSRFCPLFHVLVTACGMRTLRQHWGPINRREVTLKREADILLKEVQELVEGVT